MLEFSSSKVKQFLLEKVSEDLKQPLDVVEKVIIYQGEETLKAFTKYKSIEISGFVKLLFSINKAEKLIKNYDNILEELKDKVDESSISKKESMHNMVTHLKEKLC